MPLYAFECPECSMIAEYLVPIDGRPEGCSYCKNPNLKRYLPGQTFSHRTDSAPKKGVAREETGDIPDKFTVDTPGFHMTFEKVAEIYRVESLGKHTKKGLDN